MTPTINQATKQFEKTANEKNINLENVSELWLQTMIQGTQVCDFKTKKLFLHFVEHALTNIPKQALNK